MNNKNQNVNDVEGKTLLTQKLSFAATEAYKLLRTNLMFTLPDEQKCRIVGITSSARGEGKSTTAINLSYTLAETGKKVLLLDTDLRLPSIAKKLEIKSAPGLTNVLAGTVDISSAICKSEQFKNWDILPSGDVPPNPTELLGSSQMKTLMEKFADNYDFIIVDLPPVNIVSDALIVSPLLDGMVIVVRENFAEHRELKNCKRLLGMSNVNVLGFVINMAAEDKSSYGKYKRQRYYRKYYKSYGYYSSSSQDKK